MSKVFISTSGNSLTRAECTASGQWVVDSVLEGVPVRCLAADPVQRNLVYAGTQGSGVLRSEDRGKTWQPAGMEGHIVKSITVSPAQPGLIFAGTKPPGVFVSRDGGQRWTELESFRRMQRWWWFTPAEMPVTQPYVQALAASPIDPDLIIAGVELGAVLRSADGGKTWTGHQKGAIRDCHTLNFHPTDGNWVYQGGGSGAVYSQDAGITWISPDPMSAREFLRFMFGHGDGNSERGLQARYGWAANGDPARPDVLYCATAPGPQHAHSGSGDAQAYLYRSQSGGIWERLSGGLPQPFDHMPYALLSDPTAPGHLYVGLSNGDVWHTADYGDHWEQLPFNMGTVWAAMIMV